MPQMALSARVGTNNYTGGVSELNQQSLRDRARRAVQAELLGVAQDLFVEHGYDAVTVDQIAAAAGMSRRSFFRYFGSKDALVLGKYERHGEDLADAFAARPDDEPIWQALRRMFDGVVAYVTDPVLSRRAREMARIIGASETLRAGQLERMQRAQRLVVEQVLAREERAGRAQFTPVGAAAIVAAAFAALSTASAHARDGGVELATALDEAMRAIAFETAPAR